MTKTRLRRVKVGRRLVTYADKERRFSHWETKHVMRKRKVKNGTQIVVRTRKERDGSRVIEQQLEVPVYRSEPYTWYETVVVPKTKVRTEVVASRGTIYIEKAIHKMQGDVRGRMSVVSNDSMVVTGSIRYVDDAGRPRMLNGSDPDHDYVHNPAYTGDAVLLLLTSGDITYSTSVPPYLEINASMMTTGGKIAMQGINVSSDGKSVTVDQDVYDNPSNYIKASIRRLGGIVSRKRPVATFVNDDNVVINGFKSGVSMMDGNLVLADGGSVLPPNVLQIDRPTWVYKMAGRKVEVQ